MSDLQLTGEVEQCIKSSLECYSRCQETLNYCLQQGGKYNDSAHIRLLIDCAETCQLNASFMLRNSDMYMSTCSVCAEVCDGVAESCDQFENDDVLESCAEACRSCADLCDRVSQQSLAA